MVNMLFKKVLEENEKFILYFYLKLKAIFWPANRDLNIVAQSLSYARLFATP